jgi:hypothetical protein
MRTRAIDLALAIGALAVPGGMALPTGPADAGRPVLVIAPPWVDREGMLARAGGTPLPGGTASFALLAVFSRPGFREVLMGTGAWYVADGSVLARICGVSA